MKWVAEVATRADVYGFDGLAALVRSMPDLDYDGANGLIESVEGLMDAFDEAGYTPTRHRGPAMTDLTDAYDNAATQTWETE